MKRLFVFERDMNRGECDKCPCYGIRYSDTDIYPSLCCELDNVTIIDGRPKSIDICPLEEVEEECFGDDKYYDDLE